MTDTYATYEELVARLSSGYTAPDEADGEKMLLKASELIDFSTSAAAQRAFDGTDADTKALLSDATCDQVEFWLEVGEETDVAGLPVGSSVQLGRVQINKLPAVLGRRAIRTLMRAGLYWAGGSLT